MADQQDNQDAKAAAKAKMEAAIKAQEAGEVDDTQHVELQSETSHESGQASKDDKRPVGERNLENVKVYSPFHVYYDSDANSISAENLTGPFDVLYGHKNFMSILTPCEVVVRSQRGEERIKIDRGVMHVRNNRVTVFLDV